MSRIAKKPIGIPSAVKVTLKDGVVTVEGPKGKVERPLLHPIRVEVKDKEIFVRRAEDTILERSLQGTMHRTISGMIEGVSKGFEKSLTIEGVGFRAELKDRTLVLHVGFTHPVEMPLPAGITVKIQKPTELFIGGMSKAEVWLIAARVRSVFEPEPYKGKGIRYAGEVVRRKAGKAVVK